MALSATATQAEITNIKEALDVAIKHENISSVGEKMKLYSLSANYNGANKRWSFQFYDGGSNLHGITVDKSGKARYFARNKGSMRIFDDIDFTKLPAPNAILINGLIAQSKTALTALDFKPLDNGKLYINYYVRSEYKQKDKAYHAWNVTIPIGDGKQGKNVAFKNGKIDTINNSTIFGG